MEVTPCLGDQGSGPAVLLLHGQPGGAHDWSAVRDRLTGEFRVIVPDRPGYGAGEPLGLVANADAAVGLLDRLGVEAAAVCGHSWGGAVALLLAGRHPERVRGLVLVSSVSHTFRPNALDRMLAARVVGPALAFSGIRVLSRAALVPRVRSVMGSELVAIDDDHVRRLVAGWRRPGVWRTFVHEQRALLREAHLLADAAGAVRTPTTVVQGSDDSVVSPGRARALAAAIDGARFVGVAGAGHVLPLERPDAVALAIAETARLAVEARGAE